MAGTGNWLSLSRSLSFTQSIPGCPIKYLVPREMLSLTANKTLLLVVGSVCEPNCPNYLWVTTKQKNPEQKRRLVNAGPLELPSSF